MCLLGLRTTVCCLLAVHPGKGVVKTAGVCRPRSQEVRVVKLENPESCSSKVGRMGVPGQDERVGCPPASSPDPQQTAQCQSVHSLTSSIEEEEGAYFTLCFQVAVHRCEESDRNLMEEPEDRSHGAMLFTGLLSARSPAHTQLLIHPRTTCPENAADQWAGLGPPPPRSQDSPSQTCA